MCLRAPASARQAPGRARSPLRARSERQKATTGGRRRGARHAWLGAPCWLDAERSPPRARFARKPIPARPSDPCSARLTRCTRWLYALVGLERALRALGFRPRGSERAHDGREVRRLSAHVPLATTIATQADPSSVCCSLPRPWCGARARRARALTPTSTFRAPKCHDRRPSERCSAPLARCSLLA